jgi:hypothetical protein
MKASGIDRGAIERRAAAVLAAVPSYVWDGVSLPIPVEDIVDSAFGLRVRDVEDMTEAPGCPQIGPGDSLSGLLLTGKGEIWVNAEEARQWPPRRRFTIGHELGHHVMHHTGQQTLFCRKVAVDPDEGKPADTRPPLPVTEEEANMFAAALLMPGELMRHHYDDCGGDFDEMCSRFDSSQAAMGKRLHQTVPRSA